MYPPQFDYYRAETVAEALDLLFAHADRDPELLAGGHGLLPDMKTGEANPAVLVDIGGVDALQSIEPDEKGVTVGALATHADLAASGVLRERARVLAEAAANVADRQVRNRGTLGGNLAEADPAADLPAAVVAADATIRVQGRDGERTVPAEDFFVGREETALADGELVTAVRLPHGEGGGAYAKKTHPASGYAMVGVAAVVSVDDGEVTAARVAANGVADRAVRLRRVEDALVGAAADQESVAAAAGRAADDLDPERLVEDVHASGEFRAHLLEPYTERAVGRALERATGGEDR